jgi:cation transporter-like permease
MGSTSMPTAQQVRIAGELRTDMEKVVADTNALIAAIPAIYDAMGASGAKPTALKPVGPLPAAR